VPHEFAAYNALISRLLPQISKVSVAPVTLDHLGSSVAGLRILVWPTSRHSPHEDYAVPLPDAGTGVGQILAMAFAIVGARSNVILVDEPNAYLHPGALRSLIEYMADRGDQQFI